MHVPFAITYTKIGRETNNICQCSPAKHTRYKLNKCVCIYINIYIVWNTKYV